MRVLVLGASGMLGYNLFANLSQYNAFEVFGTVRSIVGKEKYFDQFSNNIITGIDISDLEKIDSVFKKNKPDVVINCIGLIKQLDLSKQYISAIEINALLPHQLAKLCDISGAKLIHFSTDCIFDGKSGNYDDFDMPSATDLYGRTKSLGEISYGKHLTLRTSIIGHELNSSVSLVDWFLKQKNQINGYSKAIFSGLPTCFIAKLLAEDVLINTPLQGVYNLSVNPIDKLNLLSIIASVYKKDIKINDNNDVVIDRSLNSDRIRKILQFTPPNWLELIKYMHVDYLKWYSK